MKATPAPDSDWQRIWLATRQANWTSLALVPSESGVEIADVAEALAATGRTYSERPVSVLNARGVQLGGMRELLDTLGTLTSRGEWVIVTVDPISENPTSVSVVQATSSALLVVSLGQSLFTSARAAIEMVGREKFLGSVVLHAKGGALSASLHVVLPALALLCARLVLLHA